MNATTLLVGRSGHLELRLGQACRDLRKQLGLAAWIALEELVLEAVVERDGTLTVAASARDLAERLGIGKDRAAAALATLRTVRVIVAVNAERDRSSRFVSHRYRIELPIDSNAGTVASPRPALPTATSDMLRPAKPNRVVQRRDPVADGFDDADW